MNSRRARTRERLALYLEGQARWRRQMAALRPNDQRHACSADGLRSLAAYVRSLPDEDDRIRTLACLDTSDGTVFVAGERAGEVARRYAFEKPPEAPDAWLDGFLDAHTHDRIADLAER